MNAILCLKRIIYPLLFTLLFIVAAPLTANAITNSGIVASNVIGPSVDCSNPGESQSTFCVSTQHSESIYGTGGIFDKITNIVAWAAGGAAVILMIVAGIRYVISGGDANKVSGAKNTIIGCIIGIVVIILARSLINYIVNKV
jgi:hypothetical protein